MTRETGIPGMKPCPFCGCEATTHRVFYNRCAVQCTRCLAAGPASRDPGSWQPPPNDWVEEAERLWNSRGDAAPDPVKWDRVELDDAAERGEL